MIPFHNSSDINNQNISLEYQEASAYYISANWLTQPIIIDGNITSAQEWSDATVLRLWTSKYPINATLYVKNNATHLAILCDVYGDETQDSVGLTLDQLDHFDLGFDTGNDDIQTDTQEDSFSVLANGTVLQWEYNLAGGDYNLVPLDNVIGAVMFTESTLNPNNHEIYEILISLNTIYANVGDKIGITSAFTSTFIPGWPSDDTGSQVNIYPLTAISTDLSTWGTLKLAEQIPIATITGTGNNLPVLFHCENNGTAMGRTENSDFNVSIPNGNWNQTQAVVDLTNIYAPNATIRVENASSSSLFERLSPGQVQSFRVNASCYLQNFTVEIWPNTDSDDWDILVRVYTAINNGSGTPKPSGSPATGWLFSQLLELTETPGWVYLTFNTSDLMLNVSETYDNTFFIMLYEDPGSFVDPVIYWKKWNDPIQGSGNDSADEAYVWTTVGPSWSAITAPRDFDLKVAIAPLSNSPLPSQVGIQINGSDVIDNGYGQGKWNSNQTIPGNNVLFDVHSNWTITYDVDWATKYEKTGDGQVDYQAGLLTLVNWNVTTSVEFPNNYENFVINISMQVDWNANSPIVLNGSSLASLLIYPSTNYIWYATEGIMQIKNMSEQLNYWRLACTGYNYLTELSLEKNIGTGYLGIPLGSTLNITDTIRINGTVEDKFGNPISEPNSGNLTIYNFQRTLHAENNVGATNGILSFTDWLISADTDEPGTYTIRLIWFNGSEVGLNETTINVEIPTQIFKITPTQSYFYIGAELNEINVTVFYNCTYWARRGGISDVNATLRIWNYSTLWWDWTDLDQESLGFGYYNYTIDYSSWMNGTYILQVNLNKSGYQSQEVNYTLKGVFNTSIYLMAPGTNQPSFYYPNNLTIQVNYTKETGEGILTANVMALVNGGLPIPLLLDNDLWVVQINSTDYGVGNYNVTISADQTGFFPQQIYINWTILRPFTRYQLWVNASHPQTQFHYGEIMNISIFYEDLNNSQPIENAPITLDLIGVGNQALTSEVKGLYTWLLDTSTQPAGLWNFSLSVGKPNYQSHSRILTIYVKYNTTLNWIKKPLEGSTSAQPGDELRFSVNLTRFGMPLGGQNITFRIITNIETEEFTIRTYMNGSVIFNIGYVIKSDVTDLSIEVIYAGNITDFASLLGYTITVKPPLGIFERYWWVFLIIGIAVVASTLAVRAHRRSAEAKEIAKKEILTSFQDVTKILHLVVIHKGTGADIFDYRIQERLDPTLLAGFIQAVKDFGRQLDQEGI